jgi:hypothetical protein
MQHNIQCSLLYMLSLEINYDVTSIIILIYDEYDAGLISDW